VRDAHVALEREDLIGVLDVLLGAPGPAPDDLVPTHPRVGKRPDGIDRVLGDSAATSSGSFDIHVAK
jgi:hypothetical protein